MRRKSISPIIATILLIIMTVGIAALMYTWMTGMFTELTTHAEQQAIGVGSTDFDLIFITHNSSTNTFNVTVLNKGKVILDFNRSGVYATLEYFQKPYGSVNRTTCSITNPPNISIGAVGFLNISCGLSSINPDAYRYTITVNYLGISRSITYG